MYMHESPSIKIAQCHHDFSMQDSLSSESLVADGRVRSTRGWIIRCRYFSRFIKPLGMKCAIRVAGRLIVLVSELPLVNPCVSQTCTLRIHITQMSILKKRLYDYIYMSNRVSVHRGARLGHHNQNFAQLGWSFT